MLLRQYKRVRRELGKKFHYRDIKKVYTIVLFEKSNSVFKSFSKDIYIHRFQQQSDSGIELNLLQEYTFICLDIFDDIIRNEGRKIDGRLEECWNKILNLETFMKKSITSAGTAKG